MTDFQFLSEQVLQALVTGVCTGCVYGLMCIGLSIIFSIMRVVNFAQGEFMMLGMYAAFYFATSTMVAHVVGAGPAAFLMAILGGALFFFVGAGLHRAILQPVTGLRARSTDGEGHFGQLTITLGLSLILQNGGLMLFGSTPKTIRTPLATSAWEIDIFPNWLDSIFLNKARAISALLAFLIALAFHLLLTRTQLGQKLRAAADDPLAALYLGIDVDRCYRVAFGLGAALSATAGGFLATYYPFSPFVGLDFVAIMYAGVVLGGMGSVRGAFLGGLTIGIVQQLSSLVLPNQLQMASIFVIFLAVIFLRPQGFFGVSAERT